MKTRKWQIMLLAVGALVVLGLLVFNSRQIPVRSPLPSPNGYDDFIKAGPMLAGNTGDFFVMNDEQLREIVTQNIEALNLARTGLRKECRVPIWHSQSEQSAHVSALSSIKTLALAFGAEGKLAGLENRNNDAARSHLDAMRLGHEAARGGPLIYGLVRKACEAIGLQGLQSSTTNLLEKDCREVIAALEAIEQKQETFKDVLRHEKEWCHQSFPSFQDMVGSFMRFFHFGSVWQAEQKAAQKFQTQDQRRRALLISVAARAFELEKGQRPKSISDLVPDYLKTIPTDPFTGTNMIFTP